MDDSCCSPHFTVEGTKAQKGGVMCLSEDNIGLEPWSSNHASVFSIIEEAIYHGCTESFTKLFLSSSF